MVIRFRDGRFTWDVGFAEEAGIPIDSCVLTKEHAAVGKELTLMNRKVGPGRPSGRTERRHSSLSR